MKYIYNIIAILSFSILGVACTDDPLIPNSSSAPDFNIEKFSEGYSIAFDVTFDELGGGMNTRSDINDIKMYEWENHLNPEEFRILFFDQYDRFLFESKTRYFAEQQTNDGKKSYRVGVPVFQYVSDGYDDYGANEGIPLNEEYNWERIVDIMKTEPFKIAILANRPKSVEVPTLSDWPTGGNWDKVKGMGTTTNGPFWGPLNSVATTDEVKYIAIKEGKEVFTAKILDLHHCQFDPLYYSKSLSRNAKNNGWYDFIMDFTHDYEDLGKVPFMGAMSSWLSQDRFRKVPDGTNKDGTAKYREVRYYRLPLYNPLVEYHNKYDPTEDIKTHSDCGEKFTDKTDEITQYIPMYGIQLFDPIPEWTKGKTFNVSEQTASQTGNFQYKNIFLLRSVVKLELRIPMFDNSGNYIEVDNTWAEIWFNNYMARCEPMDASTPTDQIWKENHGTDCEWLRIRNYGLIAEDKPDPESFKEKLGWYYGIWKKYGWNFKGDNITNDDIDLIEEGDNANPRIFNPLTQRLQVALITDCYLPIGEFEKDEAGEIIKDDEKGLPKRKPGQQYYHRWVVYCGEKNMNDPNYLGNNYDSNGNWDRSSKGLVNHFKIKATKKANNEDEGKTYMYYLPFTDYSDPNNPVKDYIFEEKDNITDLTNEQTFIQEYFKKIREDGFKKEYYPFPLLRNHYYRLTVSFGDNDDINVQILNSDKRNVFGIEFN